LTDIAREDVKASIQIVRTALQLVKNGPLADKLAELPLLPVDLCEKYSVDINTSKSDDISDAFLEEYIRRYATTLYHPVGTCRMAKDKSQGVVDNKLRVFGIDRLRVADASIQPEIISGNTNASCIVTGERAADILRQDHGLQSNPEGLRDAVAKYESKKYWNRYLMVFTGIVSFSLSAAVVVTVAVFKYNDRDLWK
jgi:choline dehydrogenase-like flavoprotein